MRRALLAGAVVLAAAGCGGSSTRVDVVQPKLPRVLAGSLRTQADAVGAALAANDGCTAKARAVALQAAVVDAIDAGRVPARFRPTLQRAVNDLADEVTCVPPAPTQQVTSQPGPKPKPQPKEHHPKPHHPKPHPKPPHGHGRGHKR